MQENDINNILQSKKIPKLLNKVNMFHFFFLTTTWKSLIILYTNVFQFLSLKQRFK